MYAKAVAALLHFSGMFFSYPKLLPFCEQICFPYGQDTAKNIVMEFYPSVNPPEINVFESMSTNAVTLLLLALTAVALPVTE
jgi:hypothetical protein